MNIFLAIRFSEPACKDMTNHKKDEFFYNLLVCGLMTYFMGLINVSIQMGGFTKTSIWSATKSWPITYLFAMVIATLIISKAAKRAALQFNHKRDVKSSNVIVMSCFMVLGMSICMTLFKLIMINGFTNIIWITFAKSWPRNFCIALLIRLIIVGPFARRIFGSVLKKQKASN